ncbi:MAG: transcription antitermination factor NusB [Streptosporangiaceae bacterium]
MTKPAERHPRPSGAGRSGQPRTGQPRTGQPRTGQPRAGQPRTGGSRTGRPGTDPARRAAYDVLRAVDERDAYANLLLPSVLTERRLTGRDAAFATELTYGTLRGRGTYDEILAACSDRDQLDPPVRDVLRLGVHQLLATRVGSHAAVATSVDLAKEVCGPRPSGFVNAVLRRVSTRDLDAWVAIVAPDRSRDLSGYLAVRHSYPRWIVDAFRDALDGSTNPVPSVSETPNVTDTSSAAPVTRPAEIEDALAAGNLRPEVVLAVTPGADRSAITAGPAGEFTEPTRWSPYGLRLAGGDPSPLTASGQVAVQDEASQLAVLALARVGLTGPDGLWLDLCAGPGGKARLLSGLAAARGARLVASDIRPHRARRVLDALRRAEQAEHAPVAGAVRTGAVVAADGRRVPWPSGTFDRVLADVPCSGLGSLRRRPEARWRKTPADVKELAVLQRELLNTAIDSARPGGVIAYVTCTPHIAETRDVVTSVADSRDDVTVLDAPAVLAEVPDLRCPEPRRSKDPRYRRFAQFWPHRHGTDAIFIALLRRG